MTLGGRGARWVLALLRGWRLGRWSNRGTWATSALVVVRLKWIEIYLRRLWRSASFSRAPPAARWGLGSGSSSRPARRHRPGWFHPPSGIALMLFGFVCTPTIADRLAPLPHIVAWRGAQAAGALRGLLSRSRTATIAILSPRGSRVPHAAVQCDHRRAGLMGGVSYRPLPSRPPTVRYHSPSNGMIAGRVLRLADRAAVGPELAPSHTRGLRRFSGGSLVFASGRVAALGPRWCRPVVTNEHSALAWRGAGGTVRYSPSRPISRVSAAAPWSGGRPPGLVGTSCRPFLVAEPTLLVHGPSGRLSRRLRG